MTTYRKRKHLILHGGHGKLHCSCTVSQRIKAVTDYRQLLGEGLSKRQASLTVGVNLKSIQTWDGDYERMIACSNKACLAMKGGPPSQLASIENDIIRFIFERHEQGIAVSSCTVIMYVSKLLPAFGVKSSDAKYSAMCGFLEAHDYVHHLGMHKSQTSPLAAAADAYDFVSVMHPFLYRPTCDPRFVLNMDQTPVFFSMHKTKSLEKRGLRTVNICTSKNDSARITVAITMTASGDSLHPIVIFKGE